jgi:hypothetical protein
MDRRSWAYAIGMIDFQLLAFLGWTVRCFDLGRDYAVSPWSLNHRQCQITTIRTFVVGRVAFSGDVVRELSGYFADGLMRCLSFWRTSGSSCATPNMASYSPTVRP